MQKFTLGTVLLVLLNLSAFAQSSPLSGKSLYGAIRARQIGPAVMSGRVAAMDVVNSKPQTLYVGAAGGGLWKSTSAGASFRPIFDDYTQSIGAIAIDQQHPDTVWVGTGEPWVRNSVSAGTGIYRSTNGGGTWELKGLENSERIAKILIDSAEPNTLYVAVQGHLWGANEDRGVYKTTDGGETWNKVLYLDEHTGCSGMAMDPKNPKVIYAVMWSHRRYPDFFDSGMKYEEGYTSQSGLYKSVDGGENWEKIHTGLPDAPMGRLAIAVANNNTDILYLNVEVEDKKKKGLYRSMDGGANWELVNGSFGMTVRPFYFSEMIVDPSNDSTLLKAGLNLSISEDAGERFRQVGSGVHSDAHCMWVNPSNEKHIIVGTDGGIYESYDGGYLFRMYMNLPISQFYHVSVDMDNPYNIYGGLQDNGSWYGPSRKAGGITNSDWESTVGGDGFYSMRHPKNKDIIYGEAQGGILMRYNSKTGQAKDIKPYPKVGEPKFRFNWNAPLHQSPNNPDRIYFGAQMLFMSDDMGDSWQRLSGDLTTNNPDRQRQSISGGLSVDNSTAENNTTIYYIAESPLDENIIWVGTDDGNLQVTTDQGKTWTNVALNIPELPENTWVTFVEPGHFDKNTAYVTIDNHRNDDMKPYAFKTTDMGKTWESVITPEVEGYTLSIREDLEKPNLLFLGTEFGLFISLEGGKSWTRFENNMPKVAVRDMVIHPREDALVMGTHGRGVILIDDITPLRQITAEVVAKPLYFFETKPTVLRDPGSGGGWFGGAGNFVAGNPSSNAQIVYFLKKRHTFGKMYIEVYDDKGNKLRELPAGKRGGINVVSMPTSLEKPKAAPTNNRMALFGSVIGPNLKAGTYQVKLIKGKKTYETSFTLQNDPESIYSAEDRTIQEDMVFKLYDMTEDMAYIYASAKYLEAQGKKHAESSKKLNKKLSPYVAELEKFSGSLVALGGDFYVDEDEQIRERISDLYRNISTYPGRPSQSQIERTDVLAKDMEAVKATFASLTGERLDKINALLVKQEIPALELKAKADFLDGEEYRTGGSMKQFEEFFPGGFSFSNFW